MLFLLGMGPAFAASLLRTTALAVPTLDEGGLAALVAIVGIIGGLIARHRKK
jgi:hypothetical protein